MNLGSAMAAIVLVAALPVARAEPLRDPTRPSILPATPAAPGASAPTGDGSWVLQSVRIGNSSGNSSGSGTAQAAVISGQLVPAGGRLGDSRLLRVTERSAVLEGPNGLTTLWLINDVDKREVPAALARAPKALSPAVNPPTSAPPAAPSRLAEVTR